MTVIQNPFEMILDKLERLEQSIQELQNRPLETKIINQAPQTVKRIKTKQAAALLGISETTLKRWVAQNKIKAPQKDGKFNYYLSSYIDEYIKQTKAIN